MKQVMRSFWRWS